MARAGAALAELRFGAPLGDQTRIVSAFVRVAQAGQHLLRLGDAHRVALAEAVGQGQQENDQGMLVFRFDAEHVVADALRFARFVEQAIAHGLVERRRNGFFGKRFEFEHARKSIRKLRMTADG